MRGGEARRRTVVQRSRDPSPSDGEAVNRLLGVGFQLQRTPKSSKVVHSPPLVDLAVVPFGLSLAVKVNLLGAHWVMLLVRFPTHVCKELDSSCRAVEVRDPASVN